MTSFLLRELGHPRYAVSPRLSDRLQAAGRPRTHCLRVGLTRPRRRTRIWPAILLIYLARSHQTSHDKSRTSDGSWTGGTAQKPYNNRLTACHDPNFLERWIALDLHEGSMQRM